MTVAPLRLILPSILASVLSMSAAASDTETTLEEAPSGEEAPMADTAQAAATEAATRCTITLPAASGNRRCECSRPQPVEGRCPGIGPGDEVWLMLYSYPAHGYYVQPGPLELDGKGNLVHVEGWPGEEPPVGCNDGFDFVLVTAPQSLHGFLTDSQRGYKLLGKLPVLVRREAATGRCIRVCPEDG